MKYYPIETFDDLQLYTLMNYISMYFQLKISKTLILLLNHYSLLCYNLIANEIITENLFFKIILKI